MLSQRTMEYLTYLGLFILLLRFHDSDAATVHTFEELSSENSLKAPPASHPPPTETTGTSNSNNKRDVIKRAFEECRTQLSWMCLKIEFVKMMERLMEKDELKLVPGVSVVRNVNATELKSNDLMAGM